MARTAACVPLAATLSFVACRTEPPPFPKAAEAPPASSVPVAPEEPAATAESSHAPPPDSNQHPLVDKWLLERIDYADGRPSFAPVHYGGLTFSRRGGVHWSDGCNQTGGSYTLAADGLSIVRGGTTLRGCSFPIEDVHYHRVTRFRIDGDTLTLETPTQSYVLTRFPHSRLNHHAWSLYAIVERASGEILNVDRFRTEYHHLFISFEDDSRFHFIDLDRAEFTGTLKVRGNAIEGMAYDEASRERVARRPTTLGHLPDSSRDYELTETLHPTTYAQLIAWPKVRSFRVVDGIIEQDGESVPLELLELHTDAQVYVFTPR